MPGGVEHGIKWKWTDDVTGKTVRMRVHGPGLGPLTGPNASSGPVYRRSGSACTRRGLHRS
ncbi:polymorphic toxin type 30 domain-containing protein [Streptomyces sp. NPDC048295]|uniref:polymorphic toxin type 30 domain-containing protein n=1 Tax=Streptomyces sp. NPDC048295 TaxID=3154617 RepID=UPI00341B4B64